MNEEQSPQNLVDTTDCLEAVGVFRNWKNFLFLILILCLLLLQVSFWLVDTGIVKTEAEIVKQQAATTEAVKTEKVAVPAEGEKIEEAAKEVAAEVQEKPQAPPAAATKETKGRLLFKFKHAAWVIKFLNSVLVPVTVLYCLTMMFSLKVSLLGRLGGINHISRAFFLSLLLLVLILPWQMVFAPVVAGAMFTPEELLNRVRAFEADGVFKAALYYLRFAGYGLLVVILAIFAHIRSARWTRATLRRLEII